MAISHALAQSSKPSVYEERMVGLVEEVSGGGGAVHFNSQNDQTKPKTQNQRAGRRGMYFYS